MKRHSSVTVLMGCCLALLALNCDQQPQPTPDTRAADEAAVREADAAWSKAAEAKEMEGTTGFYSYLLDDGIVLAPNQPMASGKDAIRKTMGQMFAMPGFAVKWQATKVEAARSGDLAYSLGNYELSLNDPKGKPMTDRGKYVTVWKKQADGTWKVVLDMFNSDLPSPQPSSK